MKKTDLYLKPGTYIKSNTTQGEVQGISLENFVVGVLNNPTCCTKPVFIKDGMLMTANYLSGSLQTVLDQGSNTSPLQLSTQLVRINSNLEVAERLKLESDSTVTTQTSSVIQATTTNASLVLAPNGTGAIIASVPDGTATGGNARGQYAVDLQMSRTVNDKVAGGNYSFIGAGGDNLIATTATYNGIVAGQTNSIVSNADRAFIGAGQTNTVGRDFASIVGGLSNNISQFNSGDCGFIGGGQGNSVSSSHSTISGGQSNTASTNTHATVVGGQSNTSSGLHSVTGGQSNQATSSRCVALGEQNTSSGLATVAVGRLNVANATYSVAIGNRNQATGIASLALGSLGNSYLFNQNSFGNGISVLGDCQYSTLLPYRDATLTTGATTTLFLDGSSLLIIPNTSNRMWNVQVAWVAVVTAITGTATGVTVGDTKTSTDLLAVAKRGGITTVSAHTSAGTHAIETLAGSLTAANITYAAGASQEMAITFTGPTFAGGGSVTMRVVARVQLTEVAY